MPILNRTKQAFCIKGISFCVLNTGVLARHFRHWVGRFLSFMSSVPQLVYFPVIRSTSGRWSSGWVGCCLAVPGVRGSSSSSPVWTSTRRSTCGSKTLTSLPKRWGCHFIGFLKRDYVSSPDSEMTFPQSYFLSNEWSAGYMISCFLLVAGYPEHP